MIVVTDERTRLITEELRPLYVIDKPKDKFILTLEYQPLSHPIYGTFLKGFVHENGIVTQRFEYDGPEDMMNVKNEEIVYSRLLNGYIVPDGVILLTWQGNYRPTVVVHYYTLEQEKFDWAEEGF